MGKLLTNWERIKNRSAGETIANRDVYSDQQLERSSDVNDKTMTSRIVLNIAMTVFVFFVCWIFVSLVSKGFSGLVYTIFPMGHPEKVVSFGFTFGKFFICAILSAVFYGVMHLILYHNYLAQTEDKNHANINTYKNDQHIALPEELQVKFDWFPDVGATSDVQFSSMISHVALSNKGLKQVKVARRAKEDILDEDGEVILYKGEVLRDENDNILYDTMDLLDTRFMTALFNASGLPQDKECRKFYTAGLIKYNPDGSNREKLGKFATVADLINADWELPWYETQRPAGAYLVDTAPVNTMVLAITRAGKGGLCPVCMVTCKF